MSYLSYSVGTAVPGVSQPEIEPGKTDEPASSASEQGVLLIELVAYAANYRHLSVP